MTLKLVVSAPFKSMRKEQLKKTELIYFLTIDKRWMNNDQAGKIIRMAIKEGLLEESGNHLKPSFSASDVEIPLGYKPSSDIFETEPNPVDILISEIAEKRSVDAAEVVAEINSVIKNVFDTNLEFEAAAVIVARKYRVDFSDKIPKFLKNVNETNV